MIVNAFVVLTALAVLAEVLLGGALAVLGLRAATRGRSGAGPAPGADAASPLLAVTASRLLAVTLALAVLLFLTLRSFVPQWPGVMCVQGVLRVGSHDLGSAAWLPGLLTAAALLTTATVAATAAALVVHGIDRETRTAPLARRMALWMAVAGAAAVASALVAGAYLAIPKEKPSFASGCCTVDPASIAPTATAADIRVTWTIAFFAAAGGTALLALHAARGPRVPRGPAFAAAGVGAAATTVAGAMFVQTALSPAVQHLPLHECVFCALDAAPETWLGLVAGAAGCAGVLLSVVAAACGGSSETAAPAATRAIALLRWGALGIAVSALAFATERWLA